MITLKGFTDYHIFQRMVINIPSLLALTASGTSAQLIRSLKSDKSSSYLIATICKTLLIPVNKSENQCEICYVFVADAHHSLKRQQ